MESMFPQLLVICLCEAFLLHSTHGACSAISNCETCSVTTNSSRCTQCSKGYGPYYVNESVNNITCTPCAVNCLTCDAVGGGGDYDYCDSEGCAPGNGINTDTQKCDPLCSTIEKCKLCSNSSKSCIQCDIGYGKASNNQTCQTCPPFCLGCRERTPGNLTCSSCQYGAFLNRTTNRCESCPLGCTSCNQRNTGIFSCSDCQYYGFYLNTTSGTCQKCSNGCTRCIMGGGVENCYTCLDGFYNRQYSNAFPPCLPCTANCRTCYSNLTSNCYTSACYVTDCETCSPGNGSTTCDRCLSGYVLTSSGKTCSPVRSGNTGFTSLRPGYMMDNPTTMISLIGFILVIRSNLL